MGKMKLSLCLCVVNAACFDKTEKGSSYKGVCWNQWKLPKMQKLDQDLEVQALILG